MNKTAIKNFAIWARNKLIASCEQKALMVGITEKGIVDKLPMSTADTEFYDIGTGTPYSITGKAIKQRRELVKAIENSTQDGDYKAAFYSIMEEVAYTWFNRLIALRFMEVNGYLNNDMRILSSASEGKLEPDAVTNPFDWELEFSHEEQARINELQRSNQTDELFRILFIKECNALNTSLPYLFEKTEDYSEFLLTISVTDIDGVVYKLVHDIPEEDFDIEQGGQVEIIGWLYQYYNTEPKDKVFADLKKNIKVTKDKIPAATQLFTPDWIVRYMVENSLGRLWLEGHPSDSLKSNWIYYLDEAEQEPEVKAQLDELRKDRKNIQPENIKVIDPCMGSGHILVYAFDVLMDIYREQGYVDRDAAQSIIQNNLYGLDIDQRAFQLAYFAVMMKGRQYDRRMLTRGIEPNLCAIEDSNGLVQYQNLSGDAMTEAKQLQLDDQFLVMADELISVFHDAKEYGSILNVPNQKYDEMLAYLDKVYGNAQNTLFLATWLNDIKFRLPKLVKQAKIMAAKYDVVVTNPPYMGGGNMGKKLSDFVKKNYPDSKSDLFAVFIEKCMSYAIKAGYTSMITMQSWMFLSSFEVLRKKILQKQISTLVQIGYNSFPEMNSKVAQAVAFTVEQNEPTAKGVYLDLTNKYPQAYDKKQAFFYEKKEGKYAVKQEKFAKIIGSPFAYWASENAIKAFDYVKLLDVIHPKQGTSTGADDVYVRLWHEIDKTVFSSEQKDIDNALSSSYSYYPLDKGGAFRKWYGNNEKVIKFDKKSYNEMLNLGNHLPSRKLYFKKGITWSKITSGANSYRYDNDGFIFSSVGLKGFPKVSEILYSLSLLNSVITKCYLEIISPGMSTVSGDIEKIPFIFDSIRKQNIDELTKMCISISRRDWDAFETSWDFAVNPLVAKGEGLLNKAYEAYKSETNTAFAQLKANEEELNRIFINIYGLQDELTPDVADKDVTVASIFDTKDDIPESYKGNNYVLTKEDVVKNLISYAVGCLFGRYSLKKPGLGYAGGDWQEIAAANWTQDDFERGILDDDNVIPITDEAYFEDDITGRFMLWLKEAFGADNFEENLAFIADALSVKGDNSRDVIRNYFLSGFYADHIKKYQKRPIYWLYDSGKNNGFKALIYMHRYDADTTGRVRMDYLHPMEQLYDEEINRVTTDIQESTDNREKAKLQKRLVKLEKQIKECQEYDENIAHLALERIDIDLDDGVKVNYEKVQTDRNGTKYQILSKFK